MLSKTRLSMSQFYLDENINIREVIPALPKGTKAEVLKELRPDERILDDRVPQLLLSLNQPTFVTIDQDFWHPRWCHPRYCVLYFALRDDEQELLAPSLRALLRR